MYKPCNFADLVHSSPLLRDVKQEVSELKNGLSSVKEDTCEIKDITVELKAFHLGKGIPWLRD